jgi:N-acetylneuraminic acid mutarotase
MFRHEQVSLENSFSWITGKLTSLLTLLLLLAGVSPRLAAQVNEWTWMGGSNLGNHAGVYGTLGVPGPGNVPGGRGGPAGWTDTSGNLWLFGGGGLNGHLNDLWKYTPSTGEWTWMSGSNTWEQRGVYGTLGVSAASNVPGARDGAITWTDLSGNLWLFGGGGPDANGLSGELNDLWKYTPLTGEWTWMSGSNLANQAGIYGTMGVPSASNVPGARWSAVSWTDTSGNLWLFGGLRIGGDLNDLWRYVPSTGEWTWMSGSNSANQSGVYGTMGDAGASNVPGARNSAVTWADPSGNLWLFGGQGLTAANNSGFLNDLWMFRLSTGKWTWMSGSNSANQPGVYGTLGVPDASNGPGARYLGVGWMDPSGNFWLFGGSGLSYYLNDLWKYTPATGEWAWMSGSDLATRPGVYGTLGVPEPGNVPGGREEPAGWTDSSGNLWLFGGQGVDANDADGFLNDLWRYTPAPVLPPSLTTPAPGSTLSGSTATFAWSNPENGTARFFLRLGTTVGSSDVYNGTVTTGTSEQVSGIPTNGAYLYATLWYNLNGKWYLNGKWQYSNTTYIQAGTPTPPALTTPAPGSTLTGSTVTFGWNQGAGPTRYVLRLGTTGFGSMDVYSGAATTGTSVQVTTVPTNGAKLYATLWYYLNGKWQYADATYTEAGQ